MDDLSLSNWVIWHTVINNELADIIYSHVGYLSWVITSMVIGWLYLCSALCTLKPKKT